MQPGAFAKGQISSINSAPPRPFPCVVSFAFFFPLSFKQPYSGRAAIFGASEACVGQVLEIGPASSLPRGTSHRSGMAAGRPQLLNLVGSLQGHRQYSLCFLHLPRLFLTHCLLLFLRLLQASPFGGQITKGICQA